MDRLESDAIKRLGPMVPTLLAPRRRKYARLFFSDAYPFSVPCAGNPTYRIAVRECRSLMMYRIMLRVGDDKVAVREMRTQDINKAFLAAFNLSLHRDPVDYCDGIAPDGPVDRAGGLVLLDDGVDLKVLEV